MKVDKKIHTFGLAMVLILTTSGLKGEVRKGYAYGGNIFVAALVGGVVGAATGVVPYAEKRQGQKPGDIAYHAVYGAIGAAIGLGTPLAAYEVASDKKGAGFTVLGSVLGFSFLGAAAGAGYSMVDYQELYGTPFESRGEIIMRDAAVGAGGGAALGLIIGLWEVLVWREPDSLIRPPGSGIHADLQNNSFRARVGLLGGGAVLGGPSQARWVPHMTLAKIEF